MPDSHDLATALYYTFSTVAQALAGAVGLLAAFAVLRLSGLDQLLRDEAEHIKYGVGQTVRQEAITLVSTGRIKEFLNLCRDNFDSLDAGVKEARLPWAETLQRQKEAGVRSLWVALLATGVAIVVSVVVLSTTPWLSRRPCAVMTCLSVGT